MEHVRLGGPVDRGRETRKHRHVGGERPRRGTYRGLEDDAVLSKRIDARRRIPRVAVGPDMIGAQAIDGDQDDVRTLRPAAPAG